MTINYHIFF